MSPHKCPEPDHLQSFVRLKLTDDEFKTILDHLSNCQACEETVCNLENQSETIAERIRRLAPVPFSDEPECQRLLARIRNGELSSARELDEDRTVVGQPSFVRDYQLLELLGHGGMGQVHRAIHQKLKRSVAIKLLTNGRLKDPATVARFEREMSVLGRLDHPNIVRALDAGENDGHHYLVMEFVDGVDLGVLVRRKGRLPIPEACCLIQQAAVALQYAHQRGCVHRDIKPSNLMLAKTDQGAMLKVLDLGLARALEVEDHGLPVSELTTANQIMGTLDYMAPEQGDDSHDVDIRADIYSLGATLYKLLTGEGPHAAHAGKSPLHRLMAIANSEPPKIQSKRSEIPAALAAVVHKMLAKQPDDRFATPSEVESALEPFAAGADLSMLLVPTADTAVLPSELPVFLQRAETPPPPPRRRSPWLTAFFGSAGVLMLAVIVSIATTNGIVTVESPDGKLPQDLKIVVSDGGDEVAVLQAENNWSIRIANGEYHAQIQAGTDQLELDGAQFVVQRMGRCIVKVKSKAYNTAPLPEQIPSSAPALAIAMPPDTALRAELPVDPAKPFAVVRDGKFHRAFQSLIAAVDETKDGDWIEVTSNARLTIQPSDPIAKPLRVRGAIGFRPTLYFAEYGKHQILGGVQFEDCDLDLRDGPFTHFADIEMLFHRCRIWGGLNTVPRKLTVTDSIICTMNAFVRSQHDEAHFTFRNCAIRPLHCLIDCDLGHVTLTMENCTFYLREWGFPVLAIVHGEGNLSVDASGCLFHCDSQARHLFRQDDLSKIQWKGRGNLFTGPWNHVVSEQIAQQSETLQGLANWNIQWPGREEESKELDTLAIAWGRTNRLHGPDRVNAIRKTIEQTVSQHTLPDAGPDWEIIGPGEAYVKALNKSGKGIKPINLRPERPEAGAYLLLRNDTLIEAYGQLQAAVDAALDGDVIEIRTDAVSEPIAPKGQNRTLTIRSAPGYSPSVEYIDCYGTDQLILEGLTIRDVFNTSGNCQPNAQDLQYFERPGSILRLVNCSIEARPVNGWVSNLKEHSPEITNCCLSDITIGIPPAGKLLVSNSLVRTMNILSASNSDEPSQLQLERSVVFCPDRVDGVNLANGPINIVGPLTIDSQASIFFGFNNLLWVWGHSEKLIWSGSRNVFCKTNGLIYSQGNILKLADQQNELKTDQDSIELPPFEFDAAHWQIDREASTGYQPKADGTDYGVSVERLLQALENSKSSAQIP